MVDYVSRTYYIKRGPKKAFLSFLSTSAPTKFESWGLLFHFIRYVVLFLAPYHHLLHIAARALSSRSRKGKRVRGNIGDKRRV
jgi:hypothetical protein